MITILFFARLRDIAGESKLELELPAGVETTADLVEFLKTSRASFAEALTSGTVLMAVNQAVCDQNKPVMAGDEIAFYPPVTGG